MGTGKKYSNLTLDDYKNIIRKIFGEPQNISARFDIQMDLDATKNISVNTLERVIQNIEGALKFSLEEDQKEQENRKKKKKEKKPKNFITEKERKNFLNFVEFLKPYTTHNPPTEVIEMVL